MLYYSYTLMFSLILQSCWYVVVCRYVRSLKAFVCQEIKKYLLTYLLTYLHPTAPVLETPVLSRPVTELLQTPMLP